MPTKMKSMSKMNKKELYELCKNQREQIRFHPMDMKELREENEKLKEQIQQLVYDFDSDEKNIHYKNLTEENEKLKENQTICAREMPKIEKLLENDVWVPTGTFKNNYEMLEAIFEDYKLLKSKNSKIRKANKDFAEVVKSNHTYQKSCEEVMKTQKMENNKLIHKLYKFDPETGEMKGTIIDSYKTPNYKNWRLTNLREQIVYECNDDDSMFDLGYYIKFLEK